MAPPPFGGRPARVVSSGRAGRQACGSTPRDTNPHRESAMRKPQITALTAEAVRELLAAEASPDTARQTRRFFKTGPS